MAIINQEFINNAPKYKPTYKGFRAAYEAHNILTVGCNPQGIDFAIQQANIQFGHLLDTPCHKIFVKGDEGDWKWEGDHGIDIDHMCHFYDKKARCVTVAFKEDGKVAFMTYVNVDGIWVLCAAFGYPCADNEIEFQNTYGCFIDQDELYERTRIASYAMRRVIHNLRQQ